MRAVALAVLALPVLSGCATMIHGTTQEVPVTSEPAGAEIHLRGTLLGTTPTTLTLERKPDYDLEITKQGYRPERVRLESVHEHDAASVLLGGLIGWGIDASTGGNKKLTPESVHVVLITEASATVTPGPSAGTAPIESQLARVDALRREGRINDEEHAVLRRRIIEQVTPAMLVPTPAPTAAPTPPPSSHPADTAVSHTWLLGTWQAKHIAQGIHEDDSTLTFRDGGAGLTWTMDRATVIGQRRLHLAAKGRVASIDGPTVVLEGRYTIHPTAYGVPIRYLLRRWTDDDAMTGTWIGSQQQVYRIELRKAPAAGEKR